MQAKFPHRAVKMAVRHVLRRRGLDRRRWQDDLTGEANLAAVKAMQKPSDNPEAYVYRACLRACNEYIKREWDHAKHIVDEPIPPREDGQPAAAVLLADILSVCDPIDAKIVELRARPHTHEEPSLTLEAIGLEVGLTKSAVWKRLKKIAEKLGIEETNPVFIPLILSENQKCELSLQTFSKIEPTSIPAPSAG